MMSNLLIAKLLLLAFVGVAAAKEIKVNLGGGITPGDPLEEFKRGFANREEQWHTSEIVCDREACERLTLTDAPGGFFPPYRA